ncbi:hypothetical protein FBQ82_03180 [Anaerolineae bacterium CFX7]|nr:hypothetical protein [Anaerolineae bacterium CFX7]
MKRYHFSLRQVLGRAAIIAILFGATLGLNGSLTAPPAAAAGMLAVGSFLNADGTLNLGAQPHGTFDLRGWNVTLDAVRGPVLGPAGSGAHAPSAVGDWSALGSNGAGNGSLDWTVWALAVSGSDVYVGGFFTNVNNNGTVLGAADYIAKWDGTNWSALGSNGAGDGSLNHIVYALAVSGSDLYVGGYFTNVNNNGTALGAADYIAKWDGTNWSALGSNGAGDGSLNNVVYPLAVSGSDLYVGGFFTDVNNNGTVLGAADRIAKWDGTNWSALGSDGAGDGSLNYQVNALAVSGSDLYVGGFFTDVNNNGTVLGAADNVAKWDGTNWSALGSNGAGNASLNGSVWTLAVSGSDVYVGGNFYDVNNNGTALGAADYIAKWDGTNWSALGSNGAGNGSLNYWVHALAVSGSAVYVGGEFYDVNNNGTVLGAADYIAKWDGTNWSALGSDGAGDGSLNSTVNALAVSGSDLYVGGYFTDVNNGGTVLTAADRAARFEIASPSATDLAAWQAHLTKKQNVIVKWETGNELNLLGFNVWRKVGEKGTGKQGNGKKPKWLKLNAAMIAAENVGQLGGARYTFTDRDVKPGKTYRYKLELVRPSGQSEFSQPLRVRVPR